MAWAYYYFLRNLHTSERIISSEHHKLGLCETKVTIQEEASTSLIFYGQESDWDFLAVYWTDISCGKWSFKSSSRRVRVEIKADESWFQNWAGSQQPIWFQNCFYQWLPHESCLYVPLSDSNLIHSNSNIYCTWNTLVLPLYLSGGCVLGFLLLWRETMTMATLIKENT